ncbi:MAG: ATP-binding protein [Streptosporangiales bacterium]|nr:ATP-binding protein [Streptosporangiales bacterium]
MPYVAATRPLDQRRFSLYAFPDTPRVCKRMARFAAWTWGADHDAAALITDELAANAVRATLATRDHEAAPVPLIHIRLCLFPRRMRIEIWDHAVGAPVMAEPDWQAEHGRGLSLVNGYTGGRWGWHAAASPEQQNDTTKCVWAELPRTPSHTMGKDLLMTQIDWHDQPWAQRMTAIDPAERSILANAARAILAYPGHIADPLESELTVLLESLEGKEPSPRE